MVHRFTEHALRVLEERNILREWVELTIAEPDYEETKPDGTRHYIRSIEAYGSRYLRVVVNERSEPPKIVTVFFDRRVSRRSR
ncbi:MAG TPA: DUF4258 domain-containing protein [Bacteroidetes bacterium]|nr:DUF4258 domain-containing protein [Bacteroidota bacterium]